jgi:hypothetical protein
VRFLGTHDTAWLDPRQVSPWPVQLGERSSKTKAAAFVNALKEGRAYAATGGLVGGRSALPGGVNLLLLFRCRALTCGVDASRRVRTAVACCPNAPTVYVLQSPLCCRCPARRFH